MVIPITLGPSDILKCNKMNILNFKILDLIQQEYL